MTFSDIRRLLRAPMRRPKAAGCCRSNRHGDRPEILAADKWTLLDQCERRAIWETPQRAGPAERSSAPAGAHWLRPIRGAAGPRVQRARSRLAFVSVALESTESMPSMLRDSV